MTTRPDNGAKQPGDELERRIFEFESAQAELINANDAFNKAQGYLRGQLGDREEVRSLIARTNGFDLAALRGLEGELNNGYHKMVDGHFSDDERQMLIAGEALVADVVD